MKEIVLALTLVGGAPVVAQDKPPVQVPVPMPLPSGQPAPSGAARQIPVKVTLTLSSTWGEENQQHALRLGCADERSEDKPPHGGPGAGHPDGVRREGSGRLGIDPPKQLHLSRRRDQHRLQCAGRRERPVQSHHLRSRTPRSNSIDPSPLKRKTRRRRLATSPLSARSAPASAWSCAMARRCERGSDRSDQRREVVRVDVNLTMAK